MRVSENRMLRRIFGSKRDGVIGQYRKLHNEELNDLYCSPNIVRGVKSVRISWEGNVVSTGIGEGMQGFGGET